MRNFNFMITSRNLFRGSLEKISKFETPLYSQRKSTYNGFNKNYFSLQVVYTIGYGKKINRRFEKATDMPESGSLRI